MEFKDVRATIEIDLEKGLEELWRNLDKDARWGVKKAKKEDLKIKIGKQENWDEFYKIYKRTIIRGGIAPKEKKELIKETDKLFLCLKNGIIIAGAAVKLRKDRVELFLNASLKDFLKYQPNNILYWAIIVWSKEKGYKVFDLGGYQLGTRKGDKLYEVNRFKERWGGEIKEYEILSKNPFYILGRKIVRNINFVKRWRDKRKLKKYLENGKIKKP